MIGAQQEGYVVLTGDLKSSRKLGERAEVQEDLKGSLKVVNERFEDALANVKRKGGWVAFDSGRGIDGIITPSWNLMADAIRNWSERQKEIILYYKKHGKCRDTVRSASENFGIGERSIYKTLRTGRYHLLRSVEDALKEVLN